MLRRIAFVTLLVALYSASVFTTNGCAGSSDPVQVETSIGGIVTDAATGQPIAGAEVSIQSVGATTGPDGSYYVGRLSPGQATLVVSRSGYETFEAAITLRQGVNRRSVQLNRR